MNQSTSFAQVATNQFDYLSSALCANTPPCKKHSSSRKFLTLSISLRLLLVMFMTLSVTTNAWGAEDDTYDFPQNISVSLNKCATFDDIELPEQDYPIKEVIITYAYNKSASPKAIVTIGNEEIGTKSFTGTGNLTTYKTLIFSLDSPLKGSVIISNISASDCSGSGKGTLKITNVTLVEAAPAAPCTVTLKDDNSTLTQSSAGKSVTLPSRDGCDGYEFVGWTKSWSVAQTTWTTTAPTIIPTGSYTPTANENLYPVYSKTEGGGTAYEKATTLTEGVYVMVSEKTSGIYKYMPNTTSSGSNPTLGSGITMNNGKTSLTNDITEAMLWDLTATGTANQYYLRPHGSTTIGLGCTTSTGPNIRISTLYKDVKWTITTSSNYGWQFKSNASTAMYLAVYDDDNWRNYKDATTNQKGKFYLFKQTSSSTTSYISVPDCVTETAVTLNPNGGTFTSTPDGWTKEGDKLTKEVGGSVTLPTPTYDGCYDFAGWYDAHGNKIDADAYTPTEDIELFAHWTESATLFIAMIDDENIPTVEGFAIEIGLNENGTGKVTDGVETTCGNNVYLFQTLVQGYKEVQWTVTIDGTQETIAVQNDGDVPYFVMPKADVLVSAELIECDEMDAPVVTATSTNNSITLSWDPITGANEYNVFIFYDYGNSHQQDDADVVIDGTNYTFTNLDAEHTYTYFVQAQTEIGTCFTETMGEIATASATCTVTYNANGGIGTPPSDKTEYTNGATVTVLGNYGKLTKDGYAFTGWNTEADGSGDSYKHNDQFAITASTTLYAQWCEAYWKLVTNTSELEDDTRIIIAAKEYDFALSTEQKTNNRGQAAITKKYNTVTFGTDVQTLTLVGLHDNMFALYTGSGYLYAAGSESNNYLKTGVSAGNDDWRISISQGAATILAQGTYINNQLKYNASSDLFSCYGKTNSQKDVVIYKEVCAQDQYNVNEPELTNATAANTNPTTVDADATSLTLKYSANTGYLLPETITVKMGGATLVSGTDYIWNQETGELTITVTGFYGDIDVKIVAEEDPCYGFAMSTVTATSTINSITLTWTEVAEATGYKVRLDEGEFTTATGLTHTFEGLSPKTTYTWEVQAVKDGADFHCEASKTGSTTTQKETFTVSWIVNGNTESPYATESVMDGNKITTYPNDPSAPSGCNKKVFVGWTNNPINTPTNETPAILYKQKSDIPAITGNTTLYAVWADEEEIDQESITTTTATVSIKDYADANQWETGTKYTSIKIDENITATAQKTTGNTDNTGKYYTSGEDWRLYQNESPTFVISSKEDVTIETVAITYAVANNGVLIYDGNQIASDNSVEVNGNSITFSVGNSSTVTNGQIRVSKISVIYAINTTTKVITYSAYTTLCDECTPSEDLTLKADALTADLDINGKATIAFSTTGGNGGEITYAASPKTGVTWDNGTATFTKAGEYTITASQEKNGENCPTTSNTVNVTITAIPHLYFVTDPAPITIEFDPVECGGNTRVEDKKSVSVQAYNLAAAVTAQVTGPYKIARTSGATLNEYSTTLTLDKNEDGHINGYYDDIYILSFPPAGSSEPTEGTLTFKTTNGNTLTVNLSTPTITCTPRTLTFNDRGIKTTQEYYAGTEVPEPTTPTGVCGEYEFDGWAFAKIESGSTTYAKVEFPYIMPANNQTVLHAVYRYTEVGIPEDKFMSVDANIGELESGKDYVLTGYYDSEEHNGDDEEYAVSINAYENGKYTTKVVDVNVSSTLYEEGIPYYELNTSDDEIIWTITGDNINGYTFQNKSNSKYLNVSNDVLGLSDTPSAFTIVHETGVEDGVDVYYMSLLIQPKGSSNYLSSYNKEDVGVLFNIFRSNTLSLFLYKRATTPLYTTTPDCHPSVTLISDGEVYVTATNGRGIMAATPLTLTTTDLAPNTEIAISSNSNDIYFSTERNTNFAMAQASQPKTSLTLPTNEGGELETQLYIHYKPSADGDGTPAEVVVTADVSTHNPPFTAQKTIHVRNLPAKFVIATKAGATWYALPANMNGATNPAAVVIEVDETTMTATAPNTTPYTLWPVATINGGTDRYKKYGERLRFAAVNNGNRGLWANDAKSGTTINNDAAIIAANSTAGAAYEWKITTTIVDGNWQYTLQTDQLNNQKYLGYRTAASGGAKWGTYASGNDKLYFLPVTETKPFDYKVVEWYPTKVLIQTDAAITNPIVKIGGILVNDVTCTNKGGKLYEISGLPLVNNPTKVLTLSYTADEVTYTNSKVVPIILSRETKSISGEPFVALTKEVYNYADLVVRDGATLTMDGTQDANTLWDVTIYPTSKISVPESKKLTVHSLTLFGGIDEIYNGSTYTLNKYGVPELSLKGTLYKSIAKMDYVMRVDDKQMYSLTVPYDVQLADIKYWDGSNIELGSALYVSAYDGQARANRESKTWVYETDFATKFGSATLKAGVGYTISAELQAGVGSKYSILRMPMNSNIANDATEAAKTVAVTAWGIDANITDNHKGWNLVGNPYMTTIKGADDADLVLGYLKETGTGPWEWVDDGIRYVTIPSDDGTYYWQQKFTTAELPPFKNFFVQIGTTGELQFGLGTRQSMPARSTQAVIEKEVEFEILMSNATRQDNTGLLISEEYSPAYEINADLEKMTGSMSVYTIFGGYKLAYNALSPINASEWIPVGYIAPAAGEYTFRLDDVEKIVEQVEHVYVIDYDANNIVDLMTDEYKFTTDKEQNDNRFAINVVLSQDKDNTTTGLDIIQGNNTAPIKFIYHDKMYIQSGGVIYDATGKQVTNINK